MLALRRRTRCHRHGSHPFFGNLLCNRSNALFPRVVFTLAAEAVAELLSGLVWLGAEAEALGEADAPEVFAFF